MLQGQPSDTICIRGMVGIKRYPLSKQKPKVFSYLRFSDPKQASGSSADRQLEYAKKWGSEHGMVLDETLTLRDEGLSAYHQRHVKKGALGVFLRAVEDGRVPTGSVLIVEGLDRLSRAEPIQAQAQLAQIINAGITVVTASDGRQYNRERLRAQPMDLVYSLLVMIRAHEESDTKSKRVKAAIRRQCLAWGAGTWRQPIRVGRDPQWVLETAGKFELMPERVKAIKLIIRMFKQGHGYVRILREMARLGLTISDKDGTNGSQIYRMIASRSLIGEKTVELDGEEYRLEGYYPAVLTASEFDELRNLADLRTRRKGKGEIPSIITGIGICYCGYCGTSVTAQNLTGRALKSGGMKNGYRRLACYAYRNKGCKVSGSISAVPVERALIHYCADQINLSSLLEGDSGAETLSAQLAQLKRRVADTEEQIKRVTNLLLRESDAAPTSVLKRIRELESQVDTDHQEIEGLERLLVSAAVPPPSVAKEWGELVNGVEHLDYDARMKARQLVSETFSRIVVYHRGFKPRSNGNMIGVLLMAKRGTTRLLHVDRKTGDWCAAEELDLSSLPSRHVPMPVG